MPEPDLRLVVLDRDGVINHDSDDYIKNPDEWVPLPGSLEAIAALTQAGFSVVVASNQSGVGRGLFDQATLDAIHRKMIDAVTTAGGRLDGIFFCPHKPEDACDCRKPKPGLLRQIEQANRISLHGVPVVGDSARDLDAAKAVGARPILVRTGNGAATEQTLGNDAEVFDDLAAVVGQLVSER